MATTNFIVDRIGQLIKVNSAGQTVLRLTQVTTPSLSISTESVEATDALGNTIMEIMRAKKLEVTGENALIDLNLMAEQQGTKVSSSAFITSRIEILDIASNKVTLKDEPTEAVTEIHVLDGSNPLGTTYTVDSTATDGKFAITGKEITLPNGTTGQVFVTYEYEAAEGKTTHVEATSEEFPNVGKFIIQVLGYDPCDPETQKVGYIIMNRAQLKADVDLSFETEATHAFTITPLVDYCGTDKKLFDFVIENE